MYKLRRIFKKSETSLFEVKELLEFIFVGELLSPSKEIWLVSPWISNIPILDNSLGQYLYLDPNWPKTHIRLKEIFLRLMNLGQKINIIFGDEKSKYSSYTHQLIDELKEIVNNYGISKYFECKHCEQLHSKGFLTDKNYLSGSMNFTYNGLEFWDETITFETEESSISQAKINFMSYFE